MKQALACVVILMVASASFAQEPELPEVIKITIRPASAPVPALKYRLLPELKDLTPGNAVPQYYRAFAPDWSNSPLRENLKKAIEAWQKDTRRLPDNELEPLLESGALREFDLAARRSYCDWELIDRSRKEGVKLLLPELQSLLRPYAVALSARARLQIAHREFDNAVYTFQTGFSLARHCSEGPTLIHALVGVAIAAHMGVQVEEFISAPKSPNIYWALSDLPRPLVDLRKNLQGEKLFVIAAFPNLKELETTPLPPQHVPRLADQLLIMDGREVIDPKDRLALMAATTRLYPESKRWLLAEGKDAKLVEAMPPLQAATLYSMAKYQELTDDMFKWFVLPYFEGRPKIDQAIERVKLATEKQEALPVYLELLPAVQKVYFAQAKLERRIAVLRVIEAIRIYAAAHDGRLPKTLDEIKEVPVPTDPVTGKAFEYQVNGDKATLNSPPPSGDKPTKQNSHRHELTLQR